MVFIEATSVPQQGSVRQNEPRASPDARGVRYLSFCSGLPWAFNTPKGREVWTAQVVAWEEQARATSSSERL